MQRQPAGRRAQVPAIVALVVIAGCATTVPSPSPTEGLASTPPTTPALSPSPPEASRAPSGNLRPEGRIVFLRTADGDRHTFFVANADGTQEEPITEVGVYCCNNFLDPDGTRMVVMPGGDPPGPVTGGVLSLDGTGFEPFRPGDPTLNLVPEAWSPDGRVAFEGWDSSDTTRTGIYLGRGMEVADMRRLTVRDGTAHDMALDFSPDGGQLVFHRAVKGEPDFPIDLGGSLWVVNADGTNARQLDTPPPNWWARWSPDGTRILFASERGQPDGAIWTIEADGTGLTKVWEDPAGGFPIDPTWSPDGSLIMFVLDPHSNRFTHPNNVLYVMRSDGTELTPLISTPDFKSSPEWWLP